MAPAVKDAAWSVVQSLSVPGARWVPRDNLHVTVKFLGWVDDSRIPDIASALAPAASGTAEFTIRLGGLGAFPSARRARVLWIALEDAAEGFRRLSDAVEEACSAMGFERERRGFTAHLTIARLKVSAPVELPVVTLGETMRVDRLTLFRSHLQRPSPRYEALATFPFRTTP